MISATADEKTKARGRPREFDRDAALDKALRVFSERGYHAASISELTDAMGLASGSVYKAFKDKRGIFLAAFDRYRGVRRAVLDAEMAKVATGREKIKAVLTCYAASSHGQSGKRGCLVVGSANELATLDAEAADRVAAAFRANENILLDLLHLGRSDGSVSKDVDLETTARALLCLTKGMRIVGKTGRTQEHMGAVVEVAMKLLN